MRPISSRMVEGYTAAPEGRQPLLGSVSVPPGADAELRRLARPWHKLYQCFGCGKGGDVITFVRETGEPRLRPRRGEWLADGSASRSSTRRRRRDQESRKRRDRLPKHLKVPRSGETPKLGVFSWWERTQPPCSGCRSSGAGCSPRPARRGSVAPLTASTEESLIRAIRGNSSSVRQREAIGHPRDVLDNLVRRIAPVDQVRDDPLGPSGAHASTSREYRRGRRART